MTDAQVEAEPADGNQYMFAARMVGDLDTWVTVDGTPRKRGDNLVEQRTWRDMRTTRTAAQQMRPHPIRPMHRHAAIQDERTW